MQMRVGEIATVTCSPLMAYGAAGNPPTVPPNSFVVYKIEIKSATIDYSQTDPAGPVALLGSGIASNRGKSGGTAVKKDNRMIFVTESGKTAIQEN